MSNDIHESNNFQKGVVWNYASMIIMGVSGVLMNILIILYYDSAALGIFNQVYAYYIVLSQLSTFGVHTAILKYTSENTDIKDSQGRLISAVIIVALTTLLVTSFVFLIADVALLWENNHIILLLFPALFVFSVDKILLNHLNALLLMKEYAIFQSLRYVAIIISLIIMVVLRADANVLASCLFFGELLLFLVLMAYFIGNNMIRLKLSMEWIGKLTVFGMKALPTNVILELNTKVDILCLSTLLQNNSIIGVYAFATQFTDGFYQIMVVIRRNINPYLTKMYYNKVVNKNIINKRNKNLLVAGSYIANMLLILFVALICSHLDTIYFKSLVPLSIISFAIAVNSVYIVLGNALSQIDRPELESIINTVSVAINFVLNILLINLLGIVGAAMATSVSYFAHRFILVKALKKYFPSLLIKEKV